MSEQHEAEPARPETLAERLRSLRLGRGLSLGQLTRLSGISKGHLGNIEKGRVQATARVLEELAPHLGVEAGPLIDLALEERKNLIERRFSRPRRQTAGEGAGPPPRSIADLSAEERVILSWLRSLAPGQRKALADLAGFQVPLTPPARKTAR